MKLTLKQKREIVRRFKADNSILVVAWDAEEAINWQKPSGINERLDEIEQVLRDFMNGVFALNPKKRRGGK